jgi:hypothetical protein
MYLHTAHNLHLIAHAARMQDVDAALRSVMLHNGITTGDIAGHNFCDFNWDDATVREREQRLRDWLYDELQNM